VEVIKKIMLGGGSNKGRGHPTGQVPLHQRTSNLHRDLLTVENPDKGAQTGGRLQKDKEDLKSWGGDGIRRWETNLSYLGGGGGKGGNKREKIFFAIRSKEAGAGS